MIEDWGRIDKGFLDPWTDDLEKGVCDPCNLRVHPPCPCDTQNLLWAGTFTLGSCKQQTGPQGSLGTTFKWNFLKHLDSSEEAFSTNELPTKINCGIREIDSV